MICEDSVLLRCSGNIWNDDPHGPLAFRTGEGVDFVDFLNKTGPVFFGTPSDLRQVPAYMESMHRGPAFGVFRDKRCYNTRSNEPSVDPYWEHGSTWPPTIQGRHTGPSSATARASGATGTAGVAGTPAGAS